MHKKWVRRIVGGLSFTSALFVFQACYGTPQDFGLDILLEGQVKSKSTGLPIQGIKVSVEKNIQYEFTDENGRFSFYTEILDSLKLQFEDVDEILNGAYTTKDTVLTDITERVYLDVLLEEI
ncbi:MAG: hypothetical protein RBR40_00295 [Tenuifilaceae bacterium]|nr:hypothetical protein [Tenuifilaceae bacterium]